MLSVADFLFPRDLRQSQVSFKNCLFIGSCMAETSLRFLMASRPETRFDYILFNHVVELANTPPLPAADYDFQYIQLPIRTLLSDAVIRFADFSKSGVNQEIFDSAHNVLRLMLDHAMKYNKKNGMLTFVQNFVVPQIPVVAGLANTGGRFDLRHLVQSLNTRLVEYIAKYKNAYLIDAEAIASSMGKRHFYDDTLSFFSHGGFWFEDWVGFESDRIEPLPPMDTISEPRLGEFVDAIWRACEYNYRVVHQIDAVKLVIFDLDDTLWRGLIGEHYAGETGRPSYEGWPLGVHEAIQHLKARGILVAVCSRNDRELVKRRWNFAVPLQWVKLEDFVSAEIGWGPKVEGIARIIADCSLTPKSVVFVDDNPVEREAALQAFPGIRVMGANPLNTRRILLCAPETQTRVLTAESTKRTEMVRRQKERENERKTMSREEFLANLDCRVVVDEIVDDSDPRFARAFELLNKTNQFNTDGKRWRPGEIKGYFLGGGRMIAFTVEDKFTSYGLVGVILARGGVIHQFVMSCRVLGLDIEVSVLRLVIERIRASGAATRIRASIVETDSNLPCRDVYRRAGFADMGEGKFTFAERQVPAPAPHLKINWSEVDLVA